MAASSSPTIAASLGLMVITHVETPSAMRGKGAASRLMDGIADHIRAEGRRIVPQCPYAAAWMKRHPEHADLV